MANTDDDTAPNVRSTKYTIVESKSRCLQCNTVTTVFALTLPAGYESLFVNDDDDDTPEEERETWEPTEFPAVLSYVGYLPESVATRIRALTPHYRIDHRDGEPDEAFWMNHCEHCGAQLEEEDLHGEPDSPFTSMAYLGLEAIKLHEVREPFEASVGGQSHELNDLDS